jgi:nucleotide-binding universal stress UspA family protein
MAGLSTPGACRCRSPEPIRGSSTSRWSTAGTYDTVLLPADGGYAADRAVALAAALDADLHALYVVDGTVHSAYPSDEYVDAREGPEHGFEEEGRDALADAAGRAADAGVSVIEAMEHGLPTR